MRFLVDVMSGPDVSSTFSVSESIPRGALPMYAQLFTLFRQRIEQGVWEVGAQIPSLEELTQEFEVARGTVRQAIGLLESEGLVARYRGKGTFVLERPKSNVWYRIPLDWNAFMQGTPDIEFEVLETLADQLPANPFHELGTLDGPYYFMRRRLLRNHIPYAIGSTYIQAGIYEALGREAFEKPVPLRLLNDYLPNGIAKAEQTIRAGVADLETARLLGLATGSPIMISARSVIDHQERLVYESIGVFRGDLVEVHSIIQP